MGNECWDEFGFGFDWSVVRRIDLRIELLIDWQFAYSFILFGLVLFVGIVSV